MLKEMTSVKLIQLGLEVDTWQQAIRYSAMPLFTENMIEERYIRRMIEIVYEHGPYFVITPHVALIHARSDEGALQNAIGITTLSKPVKFGSEANDPVKYIFTLSAKDNQIHLSALQELAELLEDTRFFNCLETASDPNEVMNFLNKG